MKDQIIDYLVNEGIEITISKDMKPEGYGVYYDLNTQMKSHAHLVFHEKYVKVYMRYGEHDSVDIEHQTIEEVVEDLCRIVKRCMCTRDFMSVRWEKLLIKRNILTKNVKTTTTVTYS